MDFGGSVCQSAAVCPVPVGSCVLRWGRRLRESSRRPQAISFPPAAGFRCCGIARARVSSVAVAQALQALTLMPCDPEPLVALALQQPSRRGRQGNKQQTARCWGLTAETCSLDKGSRTKSKLESKKTGVGEGKVSLYLRDAIDLQGERARAQTACSLLTSAPATCKPDSASKCRSRRFCLQ